MKKQKHFVIFGLGSFGGALATKLHENGCRVTGVDGNRERIEDLQKLLYEAVVADVTEREFLEQLALQDADAVVIALDENISKSLLATLHAKELGAKRIIVKGVNRDHGKILKQMGVEQVIFPEEATARNLADRMTWPNVLDFLPIDPEYTLVEIAVPDSMSGQSLRDVDMRRRFNVSVLGVKDALTGKLTVFPEPEFRLTDDHILLVVGRQGGIDQLRELK
jgi:trk system potassium uptake protein TrkA